MGVRTAGLWCHDCVRGCCMLVVALVHLHHHHGGCPQGRYLRRSSYCDRHVPVHHCLEVVKPGHRRRHRTHIGLGFEFDRRLNHARALILRKIMDGMQAGVADEVHGKPLRDVRLCKDLDGMDVFPDEQLAMGGSPDGRNESLEKAPPDEPLGILVGGMDEVLGGQSLDVDLGGVQEPLGMPLGMDEVLVLGRESLDTDLGGVQELLGGRLDGTQHIRRALLHGGDLGKNLGGHLGLQVELLGGTEDGPDGGNRDRDHRSLVV